MKKAMTVNLKDIKTVTSDFLEKIIKNRRKLILTVLSVFGLWCGTKIYITEPEMVSNYLSNFNPFNKSAKALLIGSASFSCCFKYFWTERLSTLPPPSFLRRA